MKVFISKAMIVVALLSYAGLVFSKTQEKPVAVELFTVEKSEIYDTYHYPVQLESEEESKHYSEISGYVISTEIKLGSVVQPGQELMRLKRHDPTYAPIQVKSQISGQVVAVPVKKGSQVQPGQLIAHVINPNALNLVIEVPAEEYRAFELGKIGEVSFEALEKPITVEVIGMSTQMKKTTGTFTLELKLNKVPIKKLYPGMIGKARFHMNHRVGIKVPFSGIKIEKDQAIVLSVKHNAVKKVPIVLGNVLDAGFQEVISGLKSGDKIVIQYQKFLADNAQVIEKSEPTP